MLVNCIYSDNICHYCEDGDLIIWLRAGTVGFHKWRLVYSLSNCWLLVKNFPAWSDWFDPDWQSVEQLSIIGQLSAKMLLLCLPDVYIVSKL
jgi:hypothetical protein